MINCSKRLMSLLEWVHAPCIADIGCDHGYVCVNAILNGQADHAYACDVAIRPLENAKKTIKQYGLETKIDCLLTDGIQGLKDDVDLIIIAGMGGLLMIDILDKGTLYPFQRLLLSCHKDSEALRRYLCSHGITIIRERIVQEKNHFYPIIECIYDKNDHVLSDKELIFGHNVICDDDYMRYLDALEGKYLKILDHVDKADIVEKINMIKEIRTQIMS